MTAFFIKTDTSAVGPFTGIELREAALAGILNPDSVIGGDPNGPWLRAVDVGLFSDKRLPLPHPPNTTVPQYHIKGLLVKADGPFKLRELIGFAARGMIRPDAHLQSNVAPEWFPINGIPMLKAVLKGDLVMLGEDGKVVRRVHVESQQVGQPASEKFAPPSRAPQIVAADAPTQEPAEKSSQTQIRQSVAPIDAVPRVASSTPSRLSSGSFQQPTADSDFGDENDEEYLAEQEALRRKGEEARELAQQEYGGKEKPKKKLEISLPDFSRLKKISPKVLIKPIAAILVVAVLGIGAYAINKMGLRQEHIIGSWIASDQTFAISFNEDGTCVCFNINGKSWSGEYEWVERRNLTKPDLNESSVIGEVSAGDELGEVKSGDGYLRLRSSAIEPNFIGTREVNDCYVRMDGEDLKIGYPTAASFSGGGKIEAGWMTVQRVPIGGVDVLSELMIMEFEDPPSPDYSIPHVSEVIINLVSMYETGEYDKSFASSPCYSEKVNASYLLSNYGAPDEARPLYPQELSVLSKEKDFDFSESQMARYGVIKMILSNDGRLQYLILMPE